MFVFHADPVYDTVFVVTPEQLDGVLLISGALYRHVVLALRTLTELYVPFATHPLVGTVNALHAPQDALLLTLSLALVGAAFFAPALQ